MQTTDIQERSYARSLIEANLSPVIIIDTEDKITDMNLVFANITGKSRDEILGTHCYDYFSDSKKVKEACKRIFKKGFINNYELTITDHKEKDVLFNGFVYKGQNGKVLGAMILGRDISKQKVIEDDLRDATKIAEEATEIAEKLTKIAEEAVKSKQQFLSNMSHEIRTPMNAIIGFTKVVLKTDLTAKQKEYLTAIKMSGDALILLINDILDLAKVDAGKMIFEKAPFKLSLSISAMLHLFETKIQEKNLTLISEYDSTIPEVLLGDSARLHQIILNLVSNAVKFTHKGNITVSVRLLSEDDKNATIQFAVTDTGIGIEENKLDKIFENFQQAYNLTSRLYGGTGLGLAIVKQLVEAQGGKIHVESKIDEGATFSFILKFKKTKKEAVLDVEIMELDTEIKDIRILVVEDMELNQLLMKTLLDDFGFECDITANGKLAIEKLETNTYDIILMDLQMPEMNGFEATKYIRNIMKSQIPIIALTADVTTVDLPKCKAVGMNDYIAKPVDERLLYSKIVGLLKKPVLIIEQKVVDNVEIEKIKYIDMSYLTKLTKANPILIKEMISIYLKQTPPLIDAMKQSVVDKDWNLLQEIIHKILPSFTIMGFNPNIQVLAKKIQEFTYTVEIYQEIGLLVQELGNSCDLACKELEFELNNIKN